MGVEILFAYTIILSLAGVVVTGIILLIKLIFGNILNARWHYFIWFLLIIRLLIPSGPEASFSIYNYLPFYQDILTEDFAQEQRTETTSEGEVAPEFSPEATFSEGATEGRESGEPNTTFGGDTAQGAESDTSLFPSTLIDGIGLREISMIWLAGVIALGAYLLAAYINLWIKVSKSRRSTKPELIKIVEDSQKRLDLKAKVEIREVSFAKAPFVMGAIKPKLVLPCNLLHELSGKELEHIILHELSHIKRRDLWVIWLTSVLQVLHWFNPVLWYAFYRMKNDCELACDANVLKHLSIEERNRYGHTVINLMETIPGFRTIPGTTGIYNNRINLRRRIQMISQFKYPTVKITIIALVLLSIAGCVSLTDPSGDSSKSLFNQEVSSEEKFTVDKDFLIMDHLLLELTPEDVKELLGEPEQISEDKEYYTDMFDDNDRLVYEYSVFIIDFVGDIEEENFSFHYLKIIDNKINGPRGIRVDQTYEEVIDNFKIDSSMENNTLYEKEQVDNIWISGRVYLDEAKEYVEQVVYIDIYEEQKANLVLNFNEQEKVEEIFLSKDPTW